MAPVVTDEELMLAYRAGDREAFRELFRRYAPRLEPMFRKRVDDPGLAQDLVQQTFLQLHRARNDFRQGALLRPWLFAIALNLVREQLRKGRRWPARLGDRDDRSLVASGPGPEARVAAARDVERALSVLSADQYDVITQHRAQGLSFAEIAETLGTSEVTVRVRAHRGYARMRQVLACGNSEAEVDVSRKR